MIKVLKKAVSIIDIIASKGKISFSDIQKRSGLNKSTLSHILTTLNNSGYVKKDPSGNYMIGDKIYKIAGKELSQNTLIEISQRHASELLQEINELVVIAMRHEYDRLNLCKLMPDKSLQVSIGDIIQHPSGWYTTATGRILMAFASKIERKEIISRIALPPSSLWPEVSGEKSLELELDKIKNEKVIYMNLDKVIDAIAVPVEDADGVFSISIACVLPIDSYSDTMTKEFLFKRLKDTARRMSKELAVKNISVSKIKEISKL